MADPFGFDPAKLSDDDLLQRQMELHRRIVWAGRFSSGETVEQLRVLLAAVEFERQERFLNAQIALRQSLFPAVIETEPDLREEPVKEVRRAESKAPMRRRPALPRTARPTTVADEPDNKDEK